MNSEKEKEKEERQLKEKEKQVLQFVTCLFSGFLPAKNEETLSSSTIMFYYDIIF